MRCSACSTPVVSDKAWRAMSPVQRKSSGARAHRGRGLCSRCYQAAIKDGSLLDSERINADRDAVFDDALMLIEERGMDYADVPAAVGMSRDALTTMIRRADRRGDPRAHRLRAIAPYTKVEACPDR